MSHPRLVKAVVRAAAVGALATIVAATPALAVVTDSYYGHLPHDGSLQVFATQRHHTGGKIQIDPNNGPNANGSMRLGLWAAGAQFTASAAIPEVYPYNKYNYMTDSTGGQTFTDRWFQIDARMVTACGWFCDDDFGGYIKYSI